MIGVEERFISVLVVPLLDDGMHVSRHADVALASSLADATFNQHATVDHLRQNVAKFFATGRRRRHLLPGQFPSNSGCCGISATTAFSYTIRPTPSFCRNIKLYARYEIIYNDNNKKIMHYHYLYLLLNYYYYYVLLNHYVLCIVELLLSNTIQVLQFNWLLILIT